MTNKSVFNDFWRFAFRVVILHTVTYSVFGLIMSNVFRYEELFQSETIRDYMRPFDSVFVMAGPFLQPIRGLLFAIGVWPIRRFLLDQRYGWLILWNTFVVFGILSTPAASPCSIEGILYSKLPLWYHLIGLPEIGMQTLTFSVVLLWWEQRATKTDGTHTHSTPPVLIELTKALMIACFAWVGYSIGGLLSVAVGRLSGANIAIDISKAASDLRIQMMFVVAFVVNLIAVFCVARFWSKSRLSLGIVFLIFWLIDTIVPWLYQWVFTHPSRVHLAFLLGLFPAVIIAMSIRLSYRRAVEPQNKAGAT